MTDQQPEPSRLRVIVAVLGIFHLFDLARELEHRGYLERIYSTFPWKRVQREGIARSQVRMFPWVNTPQVVLSRWIPKNLNRDISWLNLRTFDDYVARTLPPADVFVALSGGGLRSGRRAQQMGARYVCDRGSSHIRYQDRIITEEYRRWGVERMVVDPRVMGREEAEYEQADAVTVPSEFSRRSFIEMGVPAEKIRKIPYGVRLDRFSRTAEPAPGTFEVMFAGQIGLRKGIPYLLEGFAKLRHPRKRLRIVGAILPDIERLLPRLPQEKVEFVGHLPQPKLAEVMSTSHVMVLPSIEDGFGLVLAQAMACGCPLISSTNTGGHDLFSEGIEGFLIPIRSPEAITNRLQQLADDPSLQQKMSEAAVARVSSLGGWRAYGDRWEAVARELAGLGRVSLPS